MTPGARATLGIVRGGTGNEVNGGVERSETATGGYPPDIINKVRNCV